MKTHLTKTIIKSLIKRCASSAIKASSYLPNISSQKPLKTSIKGSFHEEVTKFDKELEKRILQNLILPDSGDGYLGEETGHINGNSGIKWIIDPIDGTSNFARRLPAYAISIAAEIDGKVVAGAIYDPSHRDMFTAGLGLGARCNGYKISSSKIDNLTEAIISTGFSKSPQIRCKQAKIISRILTEVRDVRSSGSAALDLCWLAAGRLDAYYEHDLKYWDFAAGSLIAREAGVDVLVQGDFVIGATSGLSHKFSNLLIELSQ